MRSRHSDAAADPVRPSLAARRRARRRRIIVLGTAGALVLVAAGGGVALAVTGDGGSRYRTVAAQNAGVEQIIDSVGTISSATRRDVSFSVAGTVAGVNVSVGQVVAAGATLATLDTASLQDTVDKAQADLATAQQQLSDDLASQTASAGSSLSGSSSSSSSSRSSSSTPSSTPSPQPTASNPAGGATDHGSSVTDPAVAKAVADVQHAQQALLDQYKVAAAALATSGASVTASQASCAAFLAVIPTDLTGSDDTTTDPAAPTDPATPTVPATPTEPAAPTDPATPTDPTAPDTTAVTKALADCQAALSGAMDAQTATDTQQQSLMTLATALDSSVSALQQAIQQAAASSSNGASSGSSSGASTGGSTGSQTPSGPSSQTPASTKSASTPSTGTSGGTGTSGTTQAASAATILADQAAIDLAEADVALAQSKLPFATLTSPISGTVAAVSMTPGQSVTASSSTAVVTVIGTNGYVVTTTVPLNKIDIVKLGQTATLTTPSTDTKLTGTVSSIGVLDASTTSEPSYTVVLALDPTDVQLYDGASATVRLSVAGADQVLTVPTSAVHVNGTTTTVQVLKNGTPTDVTVTVGAVGAERTEITKGISLGQQVVLANLDQAISTGTSSSTTGGLSGLGGNQVHAPGTFTFQGGGPPGGFTGGAGGGATGRG